MEALGILGVGTYLPPVVRKNDWWPPSVVAKWDEKLTRSRRNEGEHRNAELPPGGALVLKALKEYENDPFKGALERRVMPEGMAPSDMEIAACQEALVKAKVNEKDIDLLLTNSQLPDYITVPTAPRVHAALGLGEWCLAMGTEGACNSFQLQLATAEQMMRAGKIRYALLAQSSGMQHIAKPEDSYSTWFGDGAAAVVVGPVGQGKGLLASAHRTDGSMYRGLVGGARAGGMWYEKGKVELFFEEKDAAFSLALKLPELGRQVLDRAMKEAGVEPKDVDFYASHQGTHWFRRVTQEYMQLKNAKYFDSYAWTASLAAANIPFVLAMAEKEGLLKDGSLVAMYSGGSGITVSGTVLRWSNA
jgi:3-oxoacyl-[acyl-carrier-protein] synthase-3